MIDEQVAVSGDDGFGDGPMPPALDRFNLGAALLGGLWALIHGCWSWLLIFAAVRISTIGLLRVMTVSGLNRSVTLMVGVTFLLAVVDWTLSIAFGGRANRLAWEYETKRRASGRLGAGSYRLSTARFVENQRSWRRAGLVVFALSLALQLSAASNGRWALVRMGVGTVSSVAVLLLMLQLERRGKLGESS